MSVLIFARLLGKQQVGQLTFFEYVNGIIVGSIAAVLATDVGTRTTQHFIGLTLFVIFQRQNIRGKYGQNEV